MPTLQELIAQKEAIEQQILEIAQRERMDAIAQARSVIDAFGLTADELFGTKSASAARKLPAKYRDPETGKTWSGKGPTPKWLQGRNKEEFQI